MYKLITFLVVFTTSFLHAQEQCGMFSPDVKSMGFNRLQVDLDDVEEVTLPVVFHVIHKGVSDETNISDEQILSQIDALDTGFRWGPGVDTKIQFCLASRDPDGNPTNGITRHDGAELFGDTYVQDGVAPDGISDGVNDNELKSATGCWNPSEYINFYIVSEIDGNNGGNGIQGYAYLGPTGDCRDGIVQMYNVTGTTGVLKFGRELGKTAVHEMGHHLSLFHTFSNSSGCTESNCETQGDQVCDTPPTLANTSCDAVNFGDCPDAMTENFMDYTSETCKYTFTVGQAERMHEMLQGPRNGLVNNLSCLAPVEFDLAITEAFYQETWCQDFQDIWVTVTNQGAQDIPIAEVQLLCNGEQYNETVFDIEYGSGISVLFEQVFVDGAQMFEAQVVSDIDEYEFNDNAWWPISTEVGELMEILVETDVWANETDWSIYEPNGELLIGDGDYTIGGGQSFYYETCVYDGCYDVVITDTNGDGFCSIDFQNDGICDVGANGITATINGEVVFETGFGAQFSLWEESFCVEIDPCPLDYDGNGAVGNGDVIEMVVEWGCQGDCQTDPNNDGIVDVFDLLYMLTEIGDECPVEQEFSIGTYKSMVVGKNEVNIFGSRPPRIYDLSGRRIKGSLDNLSTGFYILKWNHETKKVFVQ